LFAPYRARSAVVWFKHNFKCSRTHSKKTGDSFQLQQIDSRSSHFRNGCVNIQMTDQIDGLDRQALGLWLDVTSHAVRADGPDLTARQTAMLLTIYLEQGPHTVRGLAKRLGVGKPAIVRAIDALSDAGLLTRTPDPADRRNVFIESTAQGALQLGEYARNIARNIAQMSRHGDISAPMEVDQRQTA
jgi:DNA-binding MarR family transcriptional regulator